MRRCLFLLSLLLLASCYRASPKMELALPSPELHCFPDRQSRSPFPELTYEEAESDWGKEMKVALAFAKEEDYYRAITFFKRAKILLPENKRERGLEIDYEIALLYFLGKKYEEVIATVGSSELCQVDSNFPAYHDLLLILFESYSDLGECAKAEAIRAKIETLNPQEGKRLVFFSRLKVGDIAVLKEMGEQEPYIENIYTCYCQKRKSIKTAEFYNTFFPGAGYFYVGQNQTGLTAVIINGLFIGATWLAFDHGNLPLGIILGSLEMGWYLGGISGAGIAARAHNESLYRLYSERVARREELYPVMMLRFSF